MTHICSVLISFCGHTLLQHLIVEFCFFFWILVARVELIRTSSSLLPSDVSLCCFHWAMSAKLCALADLHWTTAYFVPSGPRLKIAEAGTAPPWRKLAMWAKWSKYSMTSRTLLFHSIGKPSILREPFPVSYWSVYPNYTKTKSLIFEYFVNCSLRDTHRIVAISMYTFLLVIFSNCLVLPYRVSQSAE